jgi:hypothetical protein
MNIGRDRVVASKRFELALERLEPSDWHRFERLASVFLASEFNELRTTVNAAGDEGRDSELFSPVASFFASARLSAARSTNSFNVSQLGADAPARLVPTTRGRGLSARSDRLGSRPPGPGRRQRADPSSWRPTASGPPGTSPGPRRRQRRPRRCPCAEDEPRRG